MKNVVTALVIGVFHKTMQTNPELYSVILTVLCGYIQAMSMNAVDFVCPRTLSCAPAHVYITK